MTTAQRELTATDRLDLRELVDRYGIAIDQKDIDALVNMFVDDGRLRSFISSSTIPDYDFRGREEIGELKRRWTFPQTFHHIGNFVCERSGSEVVGTTYCLAHHLIEGDEQRFMDRVMMVVYHDRYERLADGWRIRARVLRRLWTEERGVASHNLADALARSV